MRKKIGSILKQLTGSKILWNSILISAITVLPGLVQFVYNMIIARKLGDQQYGNYYTLLSLLTIIGLPAAALQFIVSKEISLLIHRGEWKTLSVYIKKIYQIILVFLFFLIAGLIAALPFLKDFLHIPEALPFLLVFLMMPLSLLTIPVTGVMQSRERFGFYALLSLATITAKVGAGLVLVYWTNHYFGALLGLICSQAVNFIFLLFDFMGFSEYRNAPAGQPVIREFTDLKMIGRSFFFALISIGSFQFLQSLDTILVKHYLNDSSGIYSMINLLGKASIFLSTAVSFVMLPILSKDRENIVKSSLKAFSILFLILIGFALFLTFTSPFISQRILSGKYPGLEGILPLYGFMFLPFSAISFFLNYYAISEKITYSLTILGGAAALSLGIVFFHQDLFQVSLVVGITGYAILAALITDLIVLNRKQNRKPS